ncbi:sigma-70 family RNA polymerase sigma factor [Bacillus sp. KH172YL63]|uniref:sigma-70 family RNA polymerase sigma factor n=1 Tax=Bacillus sp. KH172YL63 TaxID=2709784 RepID=UPI0013E482F4|nr:sigma-70 family RNA polymerase sigma factor [Bacillus sp. KH172YL63]BCB05126.1 RNA polymerase subunit sigma [Bacillus sp. KH172YL63]
MREAENHAEDRDAWLERIMNEYGERLTKLAYNYVKDWGLAEDIVQDVFVTCFRHYEKVGEIMSFKAWIYRLAINRAKDVLKSSAFRRVVRNGSLLSLFTSKDLLPENELLRRSEEEILSRSVLDLPVKYREVMILYYYEECSIEEIEGLLGLNRNTIKTRLNRGRSRLKKRMERRGHDGR